MESLALPESSIGTPKNKWVMIHLMPREGGGRIDMGIHCYIAAFQLLLARPSKGIYTIHIFPNRG